MKSILIIGTGDSGKSTTMREVCRRLNPTKVYKLHAGEQVESEIDKIFNDTFIIEVDGIFILVVAGAPTEQSIKLSDLIEICFKLGIKISFLLVSMRSYEKSEGFDTLNELENKSEIVLTERIYKIEDTAFEDNVEWNNRINKIVELIKTNI